MITAKAYFDQLFAQATEAHKGGELNKAIALYKQLIQDVSGHPEPYHMLALIYAQKNQLDDAQPLFEKAIALNPNQPTYLNNFAELLQRKNKNEQAIELLQKAISIQPDFIEAKFKLATILKKTLQYEKAVNFYNEVIENKPEYDQAYFQLGTLYLETGNYGSAKEQLLLAVEKNPKAVKSLNNLAIVYQEGDEYDQAIMYYQQALEVKPDYEEAIRNIALLYEKMGALEEAKKHWLHLASISNNDPLVLWKADLLEPQIFESEDHIQTYRQKVKERLEWIKTQKINIDADQLTKLDIHPPSSLIYHGEDDLDIKKAYGQLFNNIPKAKLNEKLNTKPHIGFVVTGGHEGVFIKCMRGILNQISTDKFDITVICSFPNGEKIVRPQVENPEIKFVSLPKSLGQSVHLLVSLDFDFLHYWEVGTDCYNYFIPFFKPARVQCISWGWPITSGNPQIDYFLSARGLDDEESQKHYTEKLVLFDKLPVYYYRPESPQLTMSKTDFGIEDSRNIYLCTQNLRKVKPDFDLLVKDILMADKNGVVVFLGDKQTLITFAFEKRIKQNCGASSDRVICLERQNHKAYFNIINLASVLLDTTHYNGGANTNYDAFAVGAPIVTLSTSYHRGRYTAAAYRQMGFADLITTTPTDFVAKAVKVANDQAYKQELHEKIRANSDKIFEDKKAVEELENFFLRIHKDEIVNPYN